MKFSLLGSIVLAAAPAFASSTPPGDATPDAAVPSPPDLAGDWRMDLYVVSHARIPILGTTTILAQTVFQATVDGEPGDQVLHTQPCKLDPKSTRPIAKTIVPQAFVDHLPRKDVPLRFSRTTAGAWHFVGDMQPQDVGWTRTMFQPTADARVPQDREHPAVLDFEGDG
ncbi:MAG: hypothetical protein VX265_13340, partial [Myxococcota bacterium]|nr:hypothetical protein [Myxococcota bacterium]